MALQTMLLLLAFRVSAGVVEDWNETFIAAVRKETPPPCLAARNLAYFHLAILRAVNVAGNDESARLAAATQAGEEMFRSFFPSQGGLADALLAQQVRASAQAAVTTAVKLTLTESERDGATTTVHYFPSEKPGQWRRTPPNQRPPELPHWGSLKPILLDDIKPFRAPQLPSLDSVAWAAEMNEVRELGRKQSNLRTEEQTLIAEFWSDFSYTTSPAGHWNDIARDVARAKKIDLKHSARLFAVLNVAMHDACVAVWETKYHYNFWRPVTAIRRADEDGNPATTADTDWEPLLVTPPHPEYVSGHSGVSAAGAEVLTKLFGTDRMRFTVSSDTVKEVKRTFDSFSACALEVSRSRVYGGIHYSISGREGLLLGKRVAQAVIEREKKL